MTIHETIKNGIKEAMKAKDAARLSTMRNISAAMTNEVVALKRPPDQLLSDEESLAVLGRLARQRKDSIQQFTDGGRPELAEGETAELKIIEEFLPAPMSREEILNIAEAKKAELGVTDKTKLGQLIGAVAKETKGRADGALVKEIVESLLG